MGVWRGPMSGNGIRNQNDIEFDGSYRFESDGNGNWEIALYTSGTFKFKRNPGPIDVFLVGCGEDGTKGSTPNVVTVKGGDAGRGGEVKTETNVPVLRGQEYPIVIGTRDNGRDTTAFTKTSVGGTRGTAGTPASKVINGGSTASTSGGSGIRAFSDGSSLIDSTTYFGAGGGGGGAGAWVNNSTAYNVSAGDGGTNTGGDGGGTSAGSLRAYAGESADANTGGGGGGGGAVGTAPAGYGVSELYLGDFGLGGSGVCFIRNHQA